MSELDQVADLGQHIDRAARITPAESHAVLLGPGEIGDGDDVVRAAGELDQLRQNAAAGDVQREIDTIGRKRTDSLSHAVTVGDRSGAERTQELMSSGTSRADHGCAARDSELHRDAADAAGRTVD